MTLTAADMVVLTLLLWDVRIAVVEQLVRAYRVGGVRNPSAARRRVRQLVAFGLLDYAVVLARPLLDLDQPLYSWRPDAGRPNYDILPQLAYLLCRRWQEPLSSTRVYYASRKSLNIFGGVSKGAVKHYGQISHDLHVTQVALNYLERAPERMDSWQSEDTNVAHVWGAKVPDAIFYDLTKEPPRPQEAAEVGGFYGVQKLRDFFADMERRQLAFVIW